jgi:hypothetical protein
MKRMAALLATAAAISGLVPAAAGAAADSGRCGPIHILGQTFPFC